MGKYIIDIEHEDMIVNGHLVIPLEVCVQGNEEKIKFNCELTNNLTPYTEPDMEQVRKEAYDKCMDEAEMSAYKLYSPKIDEAYQRGLSDAWDAAKKIGSNSMCSLEEMGFDFGQCVFNDYNPSWYVVKNYSASECIEKIRQYEQEKEGQIQVGDEVIIRDKTAVVTEITDRYVRIMYSDGSCYALFSKGIVKTGRHFPEIAEVLQKMKES